MNKKNIRKITFLLVSISLLSACTEPGETTYIGSATGGVIGAGLGAIVGNQTGDAGGGLAIGAIAGAGAGAAIGNALEAQQKSIRTQDEAIERQQKILAAQNAEIQELRGTPTDSYPTKNNNDYNASDVRGSLSREASITEQLNTGKINPEQRSSAQLSNTGTYLSANRDRGNNVSAMGAGASTANLNAGKAFNEQDLLAAGTETGSQDKVASTTAEENLQDTSKIADALGAESSECQKAQLESQKAESAKEGADKLFYLRRAIRLCPSKAIYHKNLADQYLSLGRNEDAKAAYTDAVKLDSSLTEATQALEAISSDNIY